MLALGDALAMVVLAERGFSREDYARYHPAGDLGRRLMRVHEVMRRFLAGEDVRGERIEQPPLRFVPIEGFDPAVTHPSVPRPSGGG